MISIYVLINPINKNVFYVGATKNPRVRLKQHIIESRTIKTPKCNEILNIINRGFRPLFFILTSCSALDVSDIEEYYINFFKNIGCPINQNKKSTYSQTYVSRVNSILIKGRWVLEEAN